MTQKENSWQVEFDEKLRWLIESFINSSDQKMYREEFIKDISDLLSQARRDVMEEMAIEEIKSMELAVKEERQKVVEEAEKAIGEIPFTTLDDDDLKDKILDLLTNLKNK